MRINEFVCYFLFVSNYFFVDQANGQNEAKNMKIERYILSSRRIHKED
jgi:hypothetical protein